MSDHYPFENLPLPYAYDALEPYIDEKTMQLHHDKHLQNYVDTLNGLLKDSPYLQTMSLVQLICTTSRLRPQIGIPIARNAGGVYNHRFFFSNLTNAPSQGPSPELSEAIAHTFGSFAAFQEKFSQAAKSVFGSGYAWLVCGPQKELSILTTANQETPLTLGRHPLLTIDVWEHAYYLKHYNKRADYIKDWWNIVNWDWVNAQYMLCLKPNCGKIFWGDY